MSFIMKTFKCDHCGHAEEKLIKRVDIENNVDCPKCEAAMKMIFGAVNLSGFDNLGRSKTKK